MNDTDRTAHLAGIDDDGLAHKFASARLYAASAEDTGDVSVAAATSVLRMLGALREELDHVEVRMTEALLDAGQSWQQVGVATGRSSRQATQQRYARLGGTRRWPTRRPAEDSYVAVDHPGAPVPEDRRAWSRPWTDYRPVDITPPELRPDALAVEVPAWAEPAASPAEIDDWPQRQAEAVIAFDRDERGWPLHPYGRTGRTGRNLGKWGENAAADPIVVAGHGEHRRVLLIRRDDGAGWALPGGMVDAGETAPAALVRELAEETGLDLTEHTPTVLARQLVDDWRQTDHAWVATTAALFGLPEQVAATAGDDAEAAAWFPFTRLSATMAAAGGQLYTAHLPLLSAALAHLDRT